MVEGLVSIKGTSLASRVENISFIGITFAYSDWNLVEIAGSRGQATPKDQLRLLPLVMKTGISMSTEHLMYQVEQLMLKTAEGLFLRGIPLSTQVILDW